MSSIPITINGVICDLYGRTITGPVKIVGEAMYSDRGPGGGPIVPPEGGDKPPGGGDGKPPGIWGGPIDPYPGHPLPEPPNKPPVDPSTPPVKWKAVWHPTQGWIIVGVVDPSVDHPVPSGTSPPVV